MAANNISFYDESADLIGKDLTVELSRVYGSECRYVLALISNEYLAKTWPTFEATVWQPRVKENRVIPIFIDDVNIKEISTSICRIDLHAFRKLENKSIDQSAYNDFFNVMVERVTNMIENR